MAGTIFSDMKTAMVACVQCLSPAGPERRKAKNLILRSRVFAASRRMRLLEAHGSRRAGVYHRAALGADPLGAPQHEDGQLTPPRPSFHRAIRGAGFFRHWSSAGRS